MAPRILIWLLDFEKLVDIWFTQ